MHPTPKPTLLALLLLLALSLIPAAQASIAYGSINNFDTVNDTGHVCHGFEIEVEDCDSTEITYTYNYNHYGAPTITQDDSVPGHPKCRIRWESKKNADGTWAAYTAIPSGPINPTNGHMFTNPSINFGGEHFGVGFRAAVGAVRYQWLIDNGSGSLVHGGAVQVSTPSFTYYPPVVGVAQVQAVIAPPPPPAPEPKEFGKAVWVKEIRTTTHNNREVKLRELVSDDPEDENEKNWKNGEPDEVETEWQILQKDYNKADGGANNKVPAAAENLPGGDEVVTRRYEFYKYVGPLDNESGEAMSQSVGPDGIHGVGIKIINGVSVDLSTVKVVGDFTGSQMAAVDVDAAVGLIEHVGEGRVNTAFAARRIVVEGTLAFTAVLDGALPAGMAFDEVTGILSGTPTESGEFQFTVTASDWVNPDATKNYTLRIAAVGEDLPPASLVDTAAEPAGSGSTAGDGSYEPGMEVTVTAAPAPGFRFQNWTDNGRIVSVSEFHSFVIDVNHSLVANFTLDVPQRSITTLALPAGEGTTSGGGMFDDGTSVTVVATPALGFAFTQWTEGGVQVSAVATYVFTASVDRDLVAHFAPVATYTVSASAAPAEGGSTAGGGAYASGTSSTVVAMANPGFVFSKWTVGGTQVSTSPSYVFTVTANKTLVANFVVAGAQQTITTTSSPSAGGSTSGGGSYASGDSATVIATPNPGYIFSKWQEGSTTASTSSTYTFTVAGNRNLVAKYTEAFEISTTSTPALGGTTEMDSTTYKSGENAKATAVALPGYHFVNWTDHGVVVSTSENYSFNVTGNRSLVANFRSETDAVINVSASLEAGGTVTGGGIFPLGSMAALTATPAAGYCFTGWMEAGLLFDSEAGTSILADGDHTLVAIFIAVPPLNITPTAIPGELVISWPEGHGGWVLEESGDLETWDPSTRAIATVGGQKKVTIQVGATNTFFRLVHP